MKVLIVKLTSMGDVLHLMPALSDLHAEHPQAKIDWLVEDSFADIPSWHPAVNRIYKASTRRWRKLSKESRNEYALFVKELRTTEYDVVLDAQGLIKSAWLARKAKLTQTGFYAGFSGDSKKESPAAWAYQVKAKVGRNQHAVTRLRQLFAKVFDYSINDEANINYGLALAPNDINNKDTFFLFHGTTWKTKHIPDQRWRELSELITSKGCKVKVCWGNDAEKKRAESIALNNKMVTVLPKSSLTELAQELQTAKGAIAVDTGLGHLSAALNVPCVSIYGATDPKLTGAVGQGQGHLQSSYSCAPCLSKTCKQLKDNIVDEPCYDEFSASVIWQKLSLLLNDKPEIKV